MSHQLLVVDYRHIINNKGWHLLFRHACVGVGKARLGAALLHIVTLNTLYWVQSTVSLSGASNSTSMALLRLVFLALCLSFVLNNGIVLLYCQHNTLKIFFTKNPYYTAQCLPSQGEIRRTGGEMVEAGGVRRSPPPRKMEEEEEEVAW